MKHAPAIILIVLIALLVLSACVTLPKNPGETTKTVTAGTTSATSKETGGDDLANEVARGTPCTVTMPETFNLKYNGGSVVQPLDETEWKKVSFQKPFIRGLVETKPRDASSEKCSFEQRVGSTTGNLHCRNLWYQPEGERTGTDAAYKISIVLSPNFGAATEEYLYGKQYSFRVVSSTCVEV